jgi:Ureidoglycolate lyase
LATHDNSTKNRTPHPRRFCPLRRCDRDEGCPSLSDQSGYAERFHDHHQPFLRQAKAFADRDRLHQALSARQPGFLSVARSRLADRRCRDEPGTFHRHGSRLRATDRQGINYARNVWHYPLLVLEREGDFLVIDRKGRGNNLKEAKLSQPAVLEL